MLSGHSINNNSTATTNYASNEKKEKIVITEITELLKNFRYQVKHNQAKNIVVISAYLNLTNTIKLKVSQLLEEIITEILQPMAL